MTQTRFITPEFAVSGAPSREDLAEAAQQGFRSVINNRPDGEDQAQLTGAEEGEIAAAAGLEYRHIPVRMADVFDDDVVAAMRQALDSLPRPVLAHCKTGIRSLITWAAAEARARPAGEVLDTLRQAGVDLDHLREEIEAQARHGCKGAA